MDMLERYRGCLLGLAVGDALGAPIESFLPPDFEPVEGMVSGGVFDLPAGYWTDDTALALCLAESLVMCKGHEPVDQLERYLRWYTEGYMSSTGKCFGLGGTMDKALKRFQETREPYCGPSDPALATNGSIMRLAPVAMFYCAEPSETISKSEDSSRTTHQARESRDACRYLGALLVGALRGAKKEILLSERYEPVPGIWDKEPLAPAIDALAGGSFKHRNPPNITGLGSAVETLETALWAFWNTESFRDGCLMAVNLGGDADTAGAVYGQLAGAFYGESSIPEKWLAQLIQKDKIARMAEQLYSIGWRHSG